MRWRYENEFSELARFTNSLELGVEVQESTIAATSGYAAILYLAKTK